MAVKTSLQKPDGVVNGHRYCIRSSQRNHTDVKHEVSGDVELLLAIRQTIGRIRGTLESFGDIPVAGTLTLEATPDSYTFTGELVAFTPEAMQWQHALLSAADSAAYSLRRECGSAFKFVRITMTQTCEVRAEKVEPAASPG